MNRTILFLSVVACNGETTTPKDSATDSDTALTITEPDIYDPTWQGVQDLFVDHCDRCHPSVQYLDLRTEIPLDIAKYQYLVKPGDPDGSVLWQVVSAPNASQIPMPFDSGLLPLVTVDAIRQWIADGASLQ
jgi:hypothetical protein